MSIKPCVLAGLFIFVLAGDLVASRLQAQDLYDHAAPIVLAQNDQGFFGRIFNRSGSSSDTKPLFLNKPGQTAPAPATRDPYEFQASGRRNTGNSYGPTQWELLQREVEEQTERALLDGERAAAASRAEMDMKLAAAERAARSGGPEAVEATGRRQVYDPARVWTYNPNRRAGETNTQQPMEEPETQRRSRIYNTVQ